jgi:biopolymer transport protein ExbD
MPISAMPTTTSRIQSSPTTAAILPLVLVFLCGMTVGALAMNLGIHRTGIHLPTARPATTKDQNMMTLETWKRELNLNNDQSRQIESILDDFARYYDNVLADGNSRILLILNDKQKQKFQQMIKDRR